MHSGSPVPECFDPYYRWLSIPPSEQPPDLYRLLGIARFEPDPAVIESAADRQMAHVRTFQHGPQSHLSQKILNELATAKHCLLQPDKRAAYDSSLASPQFVTAVQPETGANSFLPDASLPTAIEPTPPSPTSGSSPKPQRAVNKRKKSHPGIEMLKIVAGGVAGVLVCIPILWYGFGVDPFNLFDEPDEVSQQDAENVADRPAEPAPARPPSRREVRETVEPPRVSQPPETPVDSNPFEQIDPERIRVLPETISPERPERVVTPTRPVIQPIPSSDAISATRDSLAEDLAETPPADLLAAADDSQDPVERYVLICGARDSAAANGNVALAFRALDILALEFEIEHLEEEAKLFEALEGASESASFHEQLAAKGLLITEKALDAQQFDLAVRISQITLKSARASNDTELVRQATLLVIRVRGQKSDPPAEDTE